jgi:hypothetical protein
LTIPYSYLENRNNPVHPVWSQCIKTRTQKQQNQQQKIYKQLEAEEHIAQWSVGHPWNKRGNLKIPRN